jgi:hypothetical protein
MNLAENMELAHRDRGLRAVEELRAAQTAPALFKPEWTERAKADLEAAKNGMRMWSE